MRHGDHVSGTVVRYDTSRGCGIIQPDDGGADVFVHHSALGRSSYEGLMPGQRVVFDVEEARHRRRARSVRSA